MKSKLLDQLFHYFKNEAPTTDREDTDADSPQDEFELCVMCGKVTDVPITMPIDQRENYEVGCGQLCTLCIKKLHGTN